MTNQERFAEIRERLTPFNPENDMVLYASMGDDIRWLISRVTELQTEVQHSQERIKELESVRLAAIGYKEWSRERADDYDNYEFWEQQLSSALTAASEKT
jgi:hypothetical protein